MKKLLLLGTLFALFVQFYSAFATENSSQTLKKEYVVLVSLDGYRHDYTDMYRPPHILQLKKEGAWSKGLRPVFPSLTFPNHYSIVTGMKAGNHGIVGNSFYDKKRQQKYSIGDSTTTRDGTWYGGEPLWILAEKNGMVAGTFFWVGSDANIQNRHASYYIPYDGKIPNHKRVDQVIKWLKLPESKRPHLITLYFSDVDSAGHKYGPNSAQTKEAVLEVDQMIGKLRAEMKALNLPVNLMVVSDHGMQKLDSEKVLYLSDYIDVENKQMKIVSGGAYFQIHISDKKLLKKTRRLLSRGSSHWRVLKKKKSLRKLGRGHPERVGDIILTPKAPYYIRTSPSDRPIAGGTHGFDPARTRSMDGIFYAAGPSIKTRKLGRFKNIHIYPLVAKILGLPLPANLDGDNRLVRKLLK
ncbi:MAG: alkaline phosphatase family protein [Halobacteriovoraceae bacterium]|jgi:predicted AlkP superfamily pyrophosphatase or phosphodiesterase|nr:alkaline phosphatase family protein [Halobacteriovoraceae bacterium]MBT5095250.1 alkaline phosphatase family protein [Halobacteriovoraceae bacterium]